MTTVTVKLPTELDLRLEAEAKRKRTSKSAVIRQLVEDGLRANGRRAVHSCYELAKDLCGSIKGAPRDLSTNKKYLEGFGG
jgi:predicted DNA-binding protein